jgi:hypothetical protein
MKILSNIKALSPRTKISLVSLFIVLIAGLSIGGYELYNQAPKAGFVTNNPFPTPKQYYTQLLVHITENGKGPTGMLYLDAPNCAGGIGGVQEEQQTYSLYICNPTTGTSIDFTRLQFVDYSSGITYTLLGGESDSFHVSQYSAVTLWATITNGAVTIAEDRAGTWENITGQNTLL